MAKKPSDTTQLIALKREYKKLSEELHFVQIERNTFRNQAMIAQTEVAEWKKRFDALLKIFPPEKV